ncbi:MarR family transcriptional regulator [Achromobacter sp. GG226]|uniref:MarR family winged helix-turn-helix transcriptional regulator n=1 Tax=Verticiella alkaliphila TaxID=2779529 RepID=UPI001C0E596B|nr:MarR family transcriptional regulator [Verticiella sp. GG226]MBU4610833.1 MarR family transcriptional regulator [Verticiella sp. GG226]
MTHSNDVDITLPDTLDQTFLLGLVGHSARLAFSMIRPHFQREMLAFDLRPSDFAVLSLISANPGLAPKQLAEAINVSPPNLAAVLARLEGRELVARERGATDQRTQCLRLTATGEAHYAAAADVVSRLEAQATAMLDDTERAELLRLLHKIAGK